MWGQKQQKIKIRGLEQTFDLGDYSTQAELTVFGIQRDYLALPNMLITDTNQTVQSLTSYLRYSICTVELKSNMHTFELENA